MYALALRNISAFSVFGTLNNLKPHELAVFDKKYKFTHYIACVVAPKNEKFLKMV
jgi:hypothetical protein